MTYLFAFGASLLQGIVSAGAAVGKALMGLLVVGGAAEAGVPPSAAGPIVVAAM